MKRSSLLMGALSMSLVAGGLSSSLAMAGDGAWYVGASVGRAKVDLPSAAAWDAEFASLGVTSTSTRDDSDTGYSIYVGRSLNKNFALELSYADFGEAGYRSNITAPVVTSATVPFEGTSWGVSVVGSLPVSERFSLQAKVGYQFWDVSASVTVAGTSYDAGSENGSDLLLGLGVKYDVSKSVAVRGFWDRYDLGGTDVDYYGVGVQVGF